MITCTHCKKELPESDFYNSNLKRGWRCCKKCCNQIAYKNNKTYKIRKKENKIRKKEKQEIAKERTFDGLFSGYNFIILNYVKKGEFKYIIKSTDGFFLQTNDLKAFKLKLSEILSRG